MQPFPGRRLQDLQLFLICGLQIGDSQARLLNERVVHDLREKHPVVFLGLLPELFAPQPDGDRLRQSRLNGLQIGERLGPLLIHIHDAMLLGVLNEFTLGVLKLDFELLKPLVEKRRA